MIDPIDSQEPIEPIESADPMLPTEATDPTLPIESTDPFDPMLRIESCDHSDHFDESSSMGTSLPGPTADTRAFRASPQFGPRC
jgi:hypothetical protein